MITVVSLVLWATVAAAFWWLAQRQSQLLGVVEELLRQAAKDRHPAGSRAKEAPTEVAAEPVAEWQPDPDPATDPVGMPPIRRPQPGPAMEPAAAVIADEWEQKRDAMVADMLAEIRGKS